MTTAQDKKLGNCAPAESTKAAEAHTKPCRKYMMTQKMVLLIRAQTRA